MLVPSFRVLAASQSVCNIYLVRHGKTDWNLQGKLQGNCDIPLNKEGEEQAVSLKKQFEAVKFDAAFSSDLSRAVRTAEILFGDKIPIQKSMALRELDYGPWQGRPLKDLEAWSKKNIPLWDQLPKDEFLASRFHENSESYADVFQRVKSVFDQQILSKYQNSSVGVITHGSVLCSFLEHLHFKQGWRWHVSNCAWIKIRAEENQLTVTDLAGIRSEQIVS